MKKHIHTSSPNTYVTLRGIITVFILSVFVLPGIAGLFSFVTPIEQAQAANSFVDPDGDGSTGGWSATPSGTFYTTVDDGVREPSTPGTSDFVQGAVNNAGNIYFRMGTISAVQSVSSVTVWLYHNDGSNGELYIQLYDDNESTTRSSETVITQRTSDTWDSVTFSGLSLTQAQLDSLSVRVRAAKNGGGPPADATVYALYADVTYTEATLDPVITLQHYRWRKDTKDEESTQFAAAEDTIMGSSVFVGDRVRLRMLVYNSGSGDASDVNYRLEYASEADSCTTWLAVPNTESSDPWQMDLSVHLPDGTVTTNNPGLTDPGSATFTAGVAKGGDNETSALSVPAGQFTELEYVISSTSSVQTETVYCFRLTNGGSTTNFTYSVEPQISIPNEARPQRAKGGVEGNGSGPFRSGGDESDDGTVEDDGEGDEETGGSEGDDGGDLG